MLARLVDEGFAANRHVHYPRNHGRVGRRRDVPRGGVGCRGRCEFASRGPSRSRSRARRSRRPPTRRVPGRCSCRPRERRSGSRSSAATARCRRSPSRPTRRSTAWVASVEGGAWEPVRPRVGGDRPPHLDPVGYGRRRRPPRSGRGARRRRARARTAHPPARPAAGRLEWREPRGGACRRDRRTRRVTISSSCRAAVGRRGTDWDSATWPCDRMPRPTRSRCGHPFPRSTDPGPSRAPTTGSPASGRPRSTPSGSACRA